MKFVTKDGTRFEVSNLTHIVINNVRRIIIPAEGKKSAQLTNKKERVTEKGTRVWTKCTFKKNVRWLKFRYPGPIPMVQDITKAEDFDSPKHLQEVIQATMTHPDKRVWFSGTYCNIEITDNWEEVKQFQQQEARRKARSKPKQYVIPTHDQLRQMIEQAVEKAGAQIQGNIIIGRRVLHGRKR